jgi:hypothetical protein
MIIYLNGSEGRLVSYLETRGYTRSIPTNITASGDGFPIPIEQSRRTAPVHGGACIFLFIIETTEPIPDA